MLTVGIAVMTVALPWDRLPSWAPVGPSLLDCGVVALLRDAEGGGQSGRPLFVPEPAGTPAGPRATCAPAAQRRRSTSRCCAATRSWACSPSPGARRSPACAAGPTNVILLLADEAGAAIERAELVARLRRLARDDALTGLPNRRSWDELLGREVLRARRTDQPLVVGLLDLDHFKAFLDLDHFKAFNDTRGHQAGDLLLKEAAPPGARSSARSTCWRGGAARSSGCCCPTARWRRATT